MLSMCGNLIEGAKIFYIINVRDINRKFMECIKSPRPNASLIAKLLKHDIDQQTKNKALFIVAGKYNNVELLVLLLENGADIHAGDDEALMRGALYDNVAIVTELLKRGANIGARDNDALISSVAFRTLLMIRKLIEGGANIHARKNEALLLAAKYHRLDVVSELLDHVPMLDNEYHRRYDHLLRMMIFVEIEFERRSYWTKDDAKLKIVTRLLELGVSLNRDYNSAACAKGSILDIISHCFDERIANTILPFCHPSEYHNFPEPYLHIYFKSKSTIKNANKM